MTGNGGSRTPNVARIHNYLLGGKDNYEEDRQVADCLLAAVPDAQAAAWANRHFLARAVRFLTAEAGIRQFIDIGAGLPAMANVHEVAQELEPLSRVINVDNNPVMVSHARALLCDGYRALFLAEQVLDMRAFLVPSGHHGCHLALFIGETTSLQVPACGTSRDRRTGTPSHA